MTIHPLLSTDLASIPGFQPSGWGEILSIHTFYTRHNFCFPLKVVIDDTIAGIGTCIVHNDVAWLGHIIVHPDFRNKGIGGFITQNLIDVAKSKSCTTTYLVATDMGKPVYSKLGFETDTEYLFFKDITPNAAWSSSVDIVKYLPEYYPQIAVIDKFISGEERMFHLDLFLDNAAVHLTNDELDGFYLPDFGDGMIQATNSVAGIALMKFRLSKKDNAVFPVDNVSAADFMKQNGFQEFRRASRMRLGVKRNVNLQYIYSRIGGNLG